MLPCGQSLEEISLASYRSRYFDSVRLKQTTSRIRTEPADIRIDNYYLDRERDKWCSPPSFWRPSRRVKSSMYVLQFFSPLGRNFAHISGNEPPVTLVQRREMEEIFRVCFCVALIISSNAGMLLLCLYVHVDTSFFLSLFLPAFLPQLFLLLKSSKRPFSALEEEKKKIPCQVCTEPCCTSGKTAPLHGFSS